MLLCEVRYVARVLGKLLFVLMMTGLVAALAAAEQAQPAQGPTEGEQMTATIDSFEGSVEVRPSPAAEWVEAEKGMTLVEGASITTGAFSTARLLFADNSVVIVQSLSEVVVD